MSETATPTRAEISAAIATKAWSDAAFHREVLADPGKAYADHFGRPLPPGITIKVVEDTPDTVHFVIPAKPSGGELSDAELENVAGGASPLAMSVLWSATGALFGVATAHNMGALDW